MSLKFTTRANEDLEELERDKGQWKRLKSVRKALALLEKDARHNSLQTHKYESLRGPNGEEVFEAYAENKTPAAYRIFWYYGSGKQKIIIAITAHP